MPDLLLHSEFMIFMSPVSPLRHGIDLLVSCWEIKIMKESFGIQRNIFRFQSRVPPAIASSHLRVGGVTTSCPDVHCRLRQQAVEFRKD